MVTASHLEMHREHLRWRVEDDMWRDDLAAWEAEIAHAISDLPRIEKALREHAEMLASTPPRSDCMNKTLSITNMCWQSTNAANQAKN